ncbi:hypothetical protein, partial [Bacillus pumilus]|uniref:hypothetical protein n=1 Tax=Bacillus pumilus TaxID=1408 RepID=UPI001C92DF23
NPPSFFLSIILHKHHPKLIILPFLTSPFLKPSLTIQPNHLNLSHTTIPFNPFLKFPNRFHFHSIYLSNHFSHLNL